MGVPKCFRVDQRRTPRRRSCRAWFVAILAGTNLLAACGVPEHMLVDKGTYPQHVDQDVRFQTNYYFRVFDYCWNRNTGEQAYIPETDTLYRYRMTGKAHSLLSNVKFEAGILDASVIDPFGTDVIVDPNIHGFRVRGPEEAREESLRVAEARERSAQATARGAALARYEQLREAYLKVREPENATETQKAAAAKVREQLELAMQQALTAYVSDLALAPSPEEQSAIAQLISAVKELSGKLPAQQPTEEVSKRLEAIEGSLAGLKQAVEGKTPLEQLCPDDKPTVRRGFQVMGPEGWKTFNQDQRLVMAMSTGAKPLIETLQEYSGRILQSRYNPADALLPLVRENLVTVQAQQAAERADPATTGVSDIFARAISAFGGS